MASSDNELICVLWSHLVVSLRAGRAYSSPCSLIHAMTLSWVNELVITELWLPVIDMSVNLVDLILATGGNGFKFLLVTLKTALSPKSITSFFHPYLTGSIITVNRAL